MENKESWYKKYNLAKAYYEYYGDLNIPIKFKTKNGYEYDEEGIPLGSWLNTQRQIYKGSIVSKISYEQIKMLEEIDIKWFRKNLDYKLQKEKITEVNLKRKKHEITSRTISVVSKFDESTLPKPYELNRNFYKVLSYKK